MADQPPRDNEDSSPDDSSSYQGCCGKIPNCIGCLRCFRNRPAPTESQSSSTPPEVSQVQESGAHPDQEKISKPLPQKESTASPPQNVGDTSRRFSSTLRPQIIPEGQVIEEHSDQRRSSMLLSPEDSASGSPRSISDTPSQLTESQSSFTHGQRPIDQRQLRRLHSEEERSHVGSTSSLPRGVGGISSRSNESPSSSILRLPESHQRQVNGARSGRRSSTPGNVSGTSSPSQVLQASSDRRLREVLLRGGLGERALPDQERNLRLERHEVSPSSSQEGIRNGINRSESSVSSDVPVLVEPPNPSPSGSGDHSSRIVGSASDSSEFVNRPDNVDRPTEAAAQSTSALPEAGVQSATAPSQAEAQSSTTPLRDPTADFGSSSTIDPEISEPRNNPDNADKPTVAVAQSSSATLETEAQSSTEPPKAEAQSATEPPKAEAQSATAQSQVEAQSSTTPLRDPTADFGSSRPTSSEISEPLNSSDNADKPTEAVAQYPSATPEAEVQSSTAPPGTEVQSFTATSEAEAQSSTETSVPPLSASSGQPSSSSPHSSTDVDRTTDDISTP